MDEFAQIYLNKRILTDLFLITGISKINLEKNISYKSIEKGQYLTIYFFLNNHHNQTHIVINTYLQIMRKTQTKAAMFSIHKNPDIPSYKE